MAELAVGDIAVALLGCDDECVLSDEALDAGDEQVVPGRLMGRIAGVRGDAVPLAVDELLDVHHVIGLVVGLPRRGLDGDEAAERRGDDDHGAESGGRVSESGYETATKRSKRHTGTIPAGAGPEAALRVAVRATDPPTVPSVR